MSFSALRLAEPIVRAISAKGYTTATDIQAGAIPPALNGRDVLGTAQTGTGKTCAFAVPIIHRLSQSTERVQPRIRKGQERHRHVAFPRALVLCPTRELATQIHASFKDYGSHVKLKFAVIYGGVKQYHQVRSMQRGVDVLVATPGRLKDLVQQRLVDLSAVKTLVLDEADRMLDMGFIADIRSIEAMTHKKRQTLLFSATISEGIRSLAGALMRDPEVVETAPESTTAESVEQRVIMVEQPQKIQLLAHCLGKESVGSALVFTRTKYGADKVARRLKQCGIAADAIHSNKTQSARNSIMQKFRAGDLQVLVATDIASRGIDVQAVTHVFNFDMPIDPETYVHRIGRTARAGASGQAITFCCRNQRKMLRAIEKRANMRFPAAENLPRMAPLPSVKQSDAGVEADDRSPRPAAKGRHRGAKPVWKRGQETPSRNRKRDANRVGGAPADGRPGKQSKFNRDEGAHGSSGQHGNGGSRGRLQSSGHEGEAPAWRNRGGSVKGPQRGSGKPFRKRTSSAEGRGPRSSGGGDASRKASPVGGKPKSRKQLSNHEGDTPAWRSGSRDGSAQRRGSGKPFRKRAHPAESGGPRSGGGGDASRKASPAGGKPKFRKQTSSHKGDTPAWRQRDRDADTPRQTKGKPFRKRSGAKPGHQSGDPQSRRAADEVGKPPRAGGKRKFRKQGWGKAAPRAGKGATPRGGDRGGASTSSGGRGKATGGSAKRSGGFKAKSKTRGFQPKAGGFKGKAGGGKAKGRRGRGSGAAAGSR